MTGMRMTLAAAVVFAATAVQAQPAPSVDFFIGNWSTVAYNDENDLSRMAGVARGYCNLPYRITRKSPETFEMYVAENLAEVRLLQRDGKFYIVPVQEDRGILRGAREVRIRDANMFTVQYLENNLNQRYGRGVFVRCGAARGR